MSGRAVYFAGGGELLGTHGAGLEAAAQACLQQRVTPREVTLPYLEGQVTLPYFKFPDDPGPLRPLLRALGQAALSQAALDAPRRRRCALLVGSSSLDVNLHEQAYLEARAAGREAIPLRNPDQGFVANCLAQDLGLDGPRHTLLTACSSGANALLYAAWMIRDGLVDDALVVGTEAFNRTSLLGFHGMLLLSKSGICRPFDAARDGIVLGEAVAAVVLSSRPQGARWRLRGGATLCDTGQPTNSSPEKIAEVIREALADAHVDAGEVVALKAHGTGTGANDLSEAAGIAAVFADRAVLPMTSLKPVLGHTLGACGVAESLVLMRCLDLHGALPAIANHATPDPELPLHPITRNTPCARGPVLLNYFGFGGNNCALVVEPVDGSANAGA